MGKKKFYQTPIREKNVITVPKPVIDRLEAKQGDLIVFIPVEDHFVVGLLTEDIIEKNIRTKIKKL